MNKIKGVYADLAGVILYDGFPPTVQKYAQLYGIKPTALQRTKDKYWAAFSLGEISPEKFWQRTFDKHEIRLSKVEARRINKEVLNAHYPYPEIIATVKDLNPHLILGLLTNTPKEWLSYWDKVYSLRELFPIIVIPSESGVRKPDIRMFQYAARKMDLGPEEILFADDQTKNVKAATQIGMIAIKVIPGTNPFLELMRNEK